MKNEALIKLVQDFSPWDAQEAADRESALRALSTFEDILSRDNPIIHLCASPWIMSRDMKSVLLVYHRLYDSWGWCGGHCDGDEDLCAVALREGMEESGLTRLQADERLLGLDILAAPRHMKHGRQLSTHLHLNFTYLCFADERETLHPCEREVKGAMWIECRNIRSHVREQHMIPVYERLCERALSRYKKA
ncbi:MAG TPA: NUDIX domain-containing protein [Candidatus Merdibacter merdavium]|uniref:NUDIX domain-containing protein n=1 Tax=Candidatus Merdibacter merdavium TaxID=2838692 RepID=A0A9D2NR55_9FIRM|nr:NUDIX domain-containing protein [Candidatus Merdibacter merdavium]